MPDKRETKVEDSIEAASEKIGKVWPLHSFVTSNPLAGFEDGDFHEAVGHGEGTFGGAGYPDSSTFRRAWEEGRVDPEILRGELRNHGFEAEPVETLERMEEEETTRSKSLSASSDERVDRVLTKWLAAFCDQGRAEAPMPFRDEGFYGSWRSLASHDGQIPVDAEELPESAEEAVKSVLSDVPEERWQEVFEYHLAALPGWTGFIKQRSEDGGEWQQENPIDLTDYVAVRLSIADAVGADIVPESYESDSEEDSEKSLRGVWLEAWERSYRQGLVESVSEKAENHADASVDDSERPEAQLVFCIDTRSEVIRRHIEDVGEYDTYGYAGFFGVPMTYDPEDTETTVDACPPIVDPAHRIEEETNGDGSEEARRLLRWSSLKEAGDDLVEILETNVATAYNYVELSGGAYGALMATRTLLPSKVYEVADRVGSWLPDRDEAFAPSLDYESTGGAEDVDMGMTHDEKVGYAEAAFSLMGWKEFSRVVAFVGHSSQTANNPHDSSLDCGACAGNPGGPSARVLASICNNEDVQDELRDRGFDIPEDTVFVAGEHNTTTDEITLYTSDVPESHSEDIRSLRADLERARENAAAERLGSDTPVREAERRAADWAETRPEWGLAGNASFVIAPRDLTTRMDLDGRAFLHSYDPETDPDGDALEEIMLGPMVVTQWINSQYYFATVDNSVYGSGSKVTQNPVGNVGVFQGNGGDLMTGLPLQSLYGSHDEPYHQPLRLTTVIHAPVDRVTDVLRRNEELVSLLDNEWLFLTVVDPEKDNEVFVYDGELEWESYAEGDYQVQEESAVTSKTLD